MSEERLIPWLRNQVVIARGAGPVVRFDLMHIGANGKYGNEVISLDGIPEDPPSDWYESVAAQLISSANADGQALSQGVQTYAVCAYRKSEPTKIKARFVYRVDGGSDLDDDSGATSEPATKQGLFAQLMRHSEAQQKTLVSAIHTIMATTQRTLARLADQNEKLQAQRIDQVEIFEDLLSKRLDREIEADKAKHRTAMMTDLVGEVKLLGPAIVNRLAGKEIIPYAANPQALALKRVWESLDESQRASLLKTLRPEQQIALAELIRAMSPETQEQVS